jgi:hypothetical protein
LYSATLAISHQCIDCVALAASAVCPAAAAAEMLLLLLLFVSVYRQAGRGNHCHRSLSLSVTESVYGRILI